MSSFELNIKIPTDFFNAFVAASKSRTETTVHKAANQAPEYRELRSSFTNNSRNEGLTPLCLWSAEHGRNGRGSISFDNLENPSGGNVRRSKASRQKTSPSESVEKGSLSVIDRCGTFFRNNILKVVLESKNGDEMKDKLPKVLLDATIQSLVDTVLGAESDAELRTYFTNKVIELLNDSDDDKTGTDSDKQNSEKQDSKKVTEENLQREKSFDYLLKIFGSILQLSEKEQQKNETVEENKDFTDEELSAIAKEVDQKVTADTPSDIPANADQTDTVQKESYVNIFGKLLSDNLGKIDKMEDKEKANPVDIFQTLLCDNLQKLGTKEGVEIGKSGSPFNILLTAFAGDKSEDVNAKSESNSFADVLGGLINLAEGKQEADPVSLFSKLFSTMHSKKPKDVEGKLEDKAESKPEVVVEDADDQLVDAADE